MLLGATGLPEEVSGAPLGAGCFGSNRAGERDAGEGPSPFQAEGPALGALFRAAQTAVLREAERPEEAEEGSGGQTRAQTAESRSILATRPARYSSSATGLSPDQS